MNETKVNELVLNLINTKACINTLTDQKKELEDAIKEELGEGGKHITPEGHAVTVTRPTTRTGLNASVIREKYPDVYKACIKTSIASAQVRLTVAKQNH